MKESVRAYELALGDSRRAILKLEEKPVFRLGKQCADNVEEGAIFLWTGEARPARGRDPGLPDQERREPAGPLDPRVHVALAVDAHRRVRKGADLVAPDAPGLKFKPVPGRPEAGRVGRAAAPPDALPGRTIPRSRTTSRARAGRSCGCCRRRSPATASRGRSLSTGPLRLRPRHRPRGLPVPRGADGRRTGREWQYALAPMTVYARRRARYRARPSGSYPTGSPRWDPSKPFFDRNIVCRP